MAKRISGNGKRNPGNKHGGHKGVYGNQVMKKDVPFRGRKKGASRTPLGKPSIPVSLRSIPTTESGVVKYLYVLDTNILMGAPDALFKFEEHDVCISGQVWKELDKFKKAKSDVGVNSRRTIRWVDELITGMSPQELKVGIPLIPPENLANGKPHDGRLLLDFTKPSIDSELGHDLDMNEPDDRIIAICLSQQAKGRKVVLVSNDGNCRVKAKMCGIAAEPYLNEAVEVLGEEDILTGFHKLSPEFWDKSVQGEVTSWHEDSVTKYSFTSTAMKKVNCNEFLLFDDGLKLMVTEKPGPHRVVAETIREFKDESVWGVTPRNVEQEFALQLLTDPRIPAVSIAGKAGSGKTFLAVAAALSQVLDSKIYNRIIITRPTTDSDEGIGYLPGTEEEKMDPWMGGFYDNLESLVKVQEEGDEDQGNFARNATRDLLASRIQVKSMNFMKGRNINNTFIIVDETQDISKKKLKLTGTRIGDNSKIVFLGNVAQIDDTYLTEYTCGMSILIRTFADSELIGHITLQRGERHPFATLVEERL